MAVLDQPMNSICHAARVPIIRLRPGVPRTWRPSVDRPPAAGRESSDLVGLAHRPRRWCGCEQANWSCCRARRARQVNASHHNFISNSFGATCGQLWTLSSFGYLLQRHSARKSPSFAAIHRNPQRTGADRCESPLSVTNRGLTSGLVTCCRMSVCG